MTDAYDGYVETDSFDRELFGELLAGSEELPRLIDEGSRLIPRFGSFVSDLFASFYKHNVILKDAGGGGRGASLRLRLLERILDEDSYNELREETVLDGFKAAVAAYETARQVLDWVRSAEGPGEKALLREWEIDRAEGNIEEMSEELETWEEVRELRKRDSKGGNTDGESDAFENAMAESASELSEEEESAGELADEQGSRMDEKDFEMKNMVRQSLGQTRERVEESDEEMSAWGSATGSEGRSGAAGKLDLASKLFKNEKIRKLSRIVGSLKEEMLRSRKKAWSKRGAEVFDVASGDDLGRLIPSELATLRHPLLRTDFKKRFMEQRLLQYYLREEKGRGPLVICLDGSSSMEGPKELWSKGVCLTLLEIAKRERRKFSVVVFSSGGAPLRVFESQAGQGGAGWGMSEGDVFDLAEYFPGGGTNFEEPLDRALEILSDSKFRRGDIVFITDGESNVGDAWLKDFGEVKEKLGFKLYSVLIDISERESWKTLSRFSDKVTSVSRLTSEEAGGLFLDL